MKRHFLEFISLLIVKAVILSGTVIVSQIIARLHGPDALAYFAEAMAAMMLLSIVMLNGADVVLARVFTMKQEDDLEKIYTSSQKSIVSPLKIALLAAAVLAYALYVTWSRETPLLPYLALLPVMLLWPLMLLRNHYLKLTGRKILSAMHEVGAINIFISFVILVVAFAYEKGGYFLSLSVSGTCLFLLTVSWALAIGRKDAAGLSGLEVDKWRRKSVAVALLNFLARNGYLLIFPYFVSASDIGYFRLEERLAFMLFFIYSLFETMWIQDYVAQVRERRGKTLWRVFLAYSGRIQIVVIMATLAAIVLIQFDAVRRLAHVVSPGSLHGLLFMAMPLQIQVFINMMFVNLRGNMNFNLVNAALGMVLFIALSAWLYPSLGLDGLRIGFFGTSALGAVLTAIPVLKVVRRT